VRKSFLFIIMLIALTLLVPPSASCQIRIDGPPVVNQGVSWPEDLGFGRKKDDNKLQDKHGKNAETRSEYDKESQVKEKQ